jgi:hypothetical protein
MAQPAETVFRGSREALSCVLFGSVASAFLALSKMMIQTLSKAICQPAEARSWMVARFGILVHSRRPESLNTTPNTTLTMRVAGLTFFQPASNLPLTCL